MPSKEQQAQLERLIGMGFDVAEAQEMLEAHKWDLDTAAASDEMFSDDGEKPKVGNSRDEKQDMLKESTQMTSNSEANPKDGPGLTPWHTENEARLEGLDYMDVTTSKATGKKWPPASRDDSLSPPVASGDGVVIQSIDADDVEASASNSMMANDDLDVGLEGGLGNLRNPPSSEPLPQSATSTVEVNPRASGPHRSARPETIPGAQSIAGVGAPSVDYVIEEFEGESSFVSQSELPIAATVVADEPPFAQAVLPFALAVKDERWKRFALVGAIMVVVGVAVALSVIFTLGNKDPPEPPKTALGTLITNASHDNGEALRNFSSPQSRALVWLQNNNTRIDDYSDEIKIQRYALATLYLSTSGASWNVSDGWLTNDKECTWYNTASKKDRLDCVNGALVGLRLGNNSLQGTIPAEVSMLSNLNYLALWGNSLTGALPSEIGLMTKLTYLSLADNFLKGTIPSEIGLLTNLSSRLSLHSNLLTGNIPTAIASLTNLDSLHLHNNTFMGHFTCPNFIEHCYVSCRDGDEGFNSTCRSL